VAIHR